MTYKITRCMLCLMFCITAAVYAQSSSRSQRDNTTGISARGALGRVETVPTGPLYEGNGGNNIRLAVLAPQAQGDVPAYLPLYIQGLINNNFNKYSKINLIDRQNLDRIIAEQNLAANGRYSDNDFVRIGNLTNAQYFLFGTIQKLSGDKYSLQLSITDSSTGVRRANFMKDSTLVQLEGRGALVNEATAELLTQLGVRLTENGLQMLLAGNTSTVLAEAGLAKGITAQAGGAEVQALFNYTQAINFDPSRIESLSRLNILSSTISGGTISQRIVNDIQARDRWLEAFKETVRFFNDHPPFEIIFDPNLIQVGQIDYTRRIANIGMRIALDSSKAGFDALNALLEGLEKTGRRATWGFSGWPFMDISPRTAGTVVFNGKQSLSFKVDVSLINENNKTIGNSSITLASQTLNFSAGNARITPPDSAFDVVSFRNIKAEDLTPSLTIVIVAVNGISSRNINASGYMKIETGDLEQKEREAAERQAQREREAAEAERLAQRQRQIQRLSDRELIIRGNWDTDHTNDYDSAIAYYNEVIRRSRLDEYYFLAVYNRSIAYNGRGIAYAKKGDYDRAIDDYTRAINMGQGKVSASAYYNRGIAYAEKGDDDRAIDDYTRAINNNINYASAYNNRGNVYLRRRDYNRAIADYEAALRIEPNNAIYKQNLQNARQARGR